MTAVEKLMTKDPIHITVPNTRKEALMLFVTSHKTGMPVVNKDNEVVGIITRKMIFQKPKEVQLALLMEWDPPTISPTADVQKAAKIMTEKGVYHLPVVKNKCLVGIITPTDLLKAVLEKGIKTPVESYISRPCVPIYDETSLAAAASIIKITKNYALPVLDHAGDLSGLVTDRDIYNLSYVNEKLVLVELGISGDEDEWTWEGLRNIMPLYFEEAKIELPPISVREIMIRNPETVYLKTDVKTAAGVMLKNDYGQLPVRDEDDRLVSLIYDIDLIRSLIEA